MACSNRAADSFSSTPEFSLFHHTWKDRKGINFIPGNFARNNSRLTTVRKVEQSPKPNTIHMKNHILENLENDGVDRRGFLKCMAWAGTGVLWTVSGGV